MEKKKRAKKYVTYSAMIKTVYNSNLGRKGEWTKALNQYREYHTWEFNSITIEIRDNGEIVLKAAKERRHIT